MAQKAAAKKAAKAKLAKVKIKHARATAKKGGK